MTLKQLKLDYQVSAVLYKAKKEMRDQYTGTYDPQKMLRASSLSMDLHKAENEMREAGMRFYIAEAEEMRMKNPESPEVLSCRVEQEEYSAALVALTAAKEDVVSAWRLYEETKSEEAKGEYDAKCLLLTNAEWRYQSARLQYAMACQKTNA